MKIKGDFDIFVSPMILESSKSFIDAVCSTFTRLHLLTAVNHAHFKCTDEVKSNNLLKKDKSLYLGQLRAEAQQTFADRKGSKKGASKKIPSISDTSVSGSCYDELQLNQIQICLEIPKVNILTLQAAVVEELISFSALDNLKDLTCVSLMCIGIDSVALSFYRNHKTEKTLQTFMENSPEDFPLPKSWGRSARKHKQDWTPAEPVTIETCVLKQDEIVFAMSVNHVHMQLRRLKNNSTLFKEAVLTVIPSQHSKVSYNFEKLPKSSKVGKFHNWNKIESSEQMWDLNVDEEAMGFIMFECGLENITGKFVKQHGFSDCPDTPSENGSLLRVKRQESVEKNPSQSSQKDVPIDVEGSVKSNESNGSIATRHSISSCVSECGSEGSKGSNDGHIRGNASSCIVELKIVWFNFAAPPQMPNTRKIDFTRLDWHLLSTATPAINAWLKPGDRFIVSLNKTVKNYRLRIGAVMACLMTEALDAQSIHMPAKSKYWSQKLAPHSKTLQEDPSCQLLSVLRKYLYQMNLETIEENLLPEFIPPYKSVYRGIIALSRQWKNILYMPLLVEQNMRLRKSLRPFNVSFAAPLIQHAPNFHDDGEKFPYDEYEVTDETTNLLVAEGGSLTIGERLADSHKISSQQARSSPDVEAGSSSSQQDFTDEGMSSGSYSNKLKNRLPSRPPRSSRASVAFPLLGAPLDSPGYYAGKNVNMSKTAKVNGMPHLYNSSSKIKRNASHQSLKSATLSVSSIDHNIPASNTGTPKNFGNDTLNADEDLYRWMARQQDYMRTNNSSIHPNMSNHNDQESKINTLTSDNSAEGDLPSSPDVHFSRLEMQLADAHIIFKPLLNKLGILSNMMNTKLSETFGSHISVSGAMDLLKVDIVESDYVTGSYRKKKLHKQSSLNQGKSFSCTSLEMPGFFCEKFSIDLSIHQIQDFEAVDDPEMPQKQLQKKAMLLMSNNFKRFTTVVNFNINVNYMVQQVNMPLLRLLHQVRAMCENVQETRLEIRANRPSSFRETLKVRRKKSSCSLDSQIPNGNLHSTNSTNVAKAAQSASPSKSISRDLNNLAAVAKHQPMKVNNKNYSNLPDNGPYSNISISPSESVAVDIPDTYSIQPSEEIKEYPPRCWRTMLYLLDLYDTMPETKTVTERLPAPPVADLKSSDISDEYKGTGKYEPLKEHKIDVKEAYVSHEIGKNVLPQSEIKKSKRLIVSHDQLKTLTFVSSEWVPLVTFGVAQIGKTRLLATLSGLKLESELSN